MAASLGIRARIHASHGRSGRWAAMEAVKEKGEVNYSELVTDIQREHQLPPKAVAAALAGFRGSIEQVPPDPVQRALADAADENVILAAALLGHGIDAVGQVTQYSRNAANQVEQVSYADGLTLDIMYG